MLDLLLRILCVLRNILLAVAWAGVELVNALVAGVAALAVLVLGLLPAMPAVPALPAGVGDAPGWIAWLIPVSAIAAAFAAMLGSYLVFLGVRVALRWVKAL